MDGRIVGGEEWERGMEEAPENGKELSHSAHANGMNGRAEKKDYYKRIKFTLHEILCTCCTKCMTFTCKLLHI
jgi:hypothetical protein